LLRARNFLFVTVGSGHKKTEVLRCGSSVQVSLYVLRCAYIFDAGSCSIYV